MSAATAASGRRRSRPIVFRLLAILLGLSPFLGVELALRALDWGRPSDYDDPFVGFSDIHPLFVRNEASGRYETARSRLPWFNPESFAAPKPADEFRVFVLGESTVQGQPYGPETAFAAWLELSLQAAAPERRWRVVNCGGISYASYRLVPILQELLGYEPDFFVICSGHNEFLEDRTYHHLKNECCPLGWAQRQAARLRLFTLLRAGVRSVRSDTVANDRPQLGPEVDARLDWAGGLAQYHRDDAWHNDVIEHYAFNLRRMAALARGARVPLLLVAPISNLDWPPFKSEHRAGLAEDERRRFEQLCEEGRALGEKDLEGAIDRFSQARDLDDQYAELHYHVGKYYQALGDWPRARESLAQAKELDVCPLRMLQPMRERLRQVADEAGVPLLDADALFAARSRGGIPGPEWLVDHVHPKLEGHQLIADAIADELVRGGIVKPGAGWSEARHEAYRTQLDRLPATYFARAEYRLEGILRWAHGKVTKERPQ